MIPLGTLVVIPSLVIPSPQTQISGPLIVHTPHIAPHTLGNMWSGSFLSVVSCLSILGSRGYVAVARVFARGYLRSFIADGIGILLTDSERVRRAKTWRKSLLPGLGRESTGRDFHSRELQS